MGLPQRLLLAVLAVVAIAGQPALAQESWPNRPVKIVVGFAPGGATDVVARALAKELGELWGQPVVVENRTGAGGNIGTEVVAKSPPDGYTMLMASGAITINPQIHAKLPFDTEKDLIAVTNVATGPQVVVINPGVRAKTLQEFIALARANPGKLNFGSAGVGSQVHMAGENFADAAGIDVVHVPYKGEAPAYGDLIGGQIQFMVGNIAGVAPHVTNGTIRALAVTSATRSPMLPDVPTTAEGGLAGFESAGWFGLLVPAGTPAAIVNKIRNDTVKVLERKEMKDRLATQGMAPVGNTPAEFARAMQEESARWKKVVKSRNLKVE
jgi:tripartite-type tricarboxylate transporter receptor subunit TctC